MRLADGGSGRLQALTLAHNERIIIPAANQDETGSGCWEDATMTQLTLALTGTLSPELRQVATDEAVEAEELRRSVAAGHVVIPANRNHQNLKPAGIGKGLRVKVNANLGSSPDRCDPDAEICKLEAAIAAGADALMDLSTGGDISQMRRELLARCPLPFGTVPIYQAACETTKQGYAIGEMDPDLLFDVIEEHADEGVDFITVHCGITREGLALAAKRVMGVVSRGGSFLRLLMETQRRENPLYEQYDRLLDIAGKHDVTLSLGDGLRPGCLADATDAAQMHELTVMGELVRRARQAGVQAMVEGPGHIPLNQVAANVQVQKSICDGAPFYVLGPLVTDVAAGYDHIAAAIGGAVAGLAGADFLCYVTPAEHLGLPDPGDVYEGVVASRIAAHAVDVARGIAGAREWDAAMSRARKALDWAKQMDLALDPERASRLFHERTGEPREGGCSMCGEFCPYRA